MRAGLSFLALLGASAVVALQSPHKKAAKFAPKKQKVVQASTALRPIQESIYLTNKTACKRHAIARGTVVLNLSSIRGKRECVARGQF